jgi:dTDP-4-dehydrorhamnose 3,5-epimerase
VGANARMNFTALEIQNCFAFTSDLISDRRGTLSRIWEENSIFSSFKTVEASFVTNPKLGTLRGLHFQSDYYAENKVIQCIRGKAFDVVLDIRKESKTYRKHVGLEIGPECRFQGLFVPAGCAHGYLTLESDTSLVYFMDNAYSPEESHGIRWDDPNWMISWPFNPSLVSQQDLEWPEREL